MTPPMTPRPPGVLVVDDEPSVRALLAAYLRFLGVTPYPAAGAVEAVAQLRSHSGEIGATLIDLNMPGLDGLETRRRLGAVKPGLRCALMSGMQPGPGGAPEGFDWVLDKPFGLAKLKACLEALRVVSSHASV
jgi:CheY-like chemotaxis protein